MELMVIIAVVLTLVAVGVPAFLDTMPGLRLADAARQCVVNAIAAVQMLPGGVEQIAGVVRVGAFVHSDATFYDQPGVANAASELLKEIFGDAGQHARAAVGVNTLPRDASVEIEVIFEAR